MKYKKEPGYFNGEGEVLGDFQGVPEWYSGHVPRGNLNGKCWKCECFLC